jgi:hypothetical protein
MAFEIARRVQRNLDEHELTNERVVVRHELF